MTFRNLSNLGANLKSEHFHNCTYGSRCLPVYVPAPTQENATESFQAWIHLSVLSKRLPGCWQPSHEGDQKPLDLYICVPCKYCKCFSPLPTKGSLWPACSTTEIKHRTSSFVMGLTNGNQVNQWHNAIEGLKGWVMEDVIPAEQRQMLFWLPVRHRERC